MAQRRWRRCGFVLAHIGGGTPRDFGPCGDVLDRNAPLLFSHFERRYTYFLPVTPPVEECLLVPFYAEGKAVGTIWAISHDTRRKFDAEDLRQLVSLGTFASSAYQAVQYFDALERQGKALCESDAMLRFSHQAARAGTWTWEASTGLVTWSKECYELFGIDPQTPLLYDSWRNALHPEDRERADSAARQAMDRREDLNLEYRIHHPQRGVRWLTSIGRMIDPANRPGYMTGLSLDITERKRLEAELAAWHRELESRVAQQKKELAAARAQVLADSDERQRLEAEVAEAVEGEQLRLGQELHDGLAQELTGIGMMLDTVAEKLSKPSPANARQLRRLCLMLAKARDDAQQTGEELLPRGDRAIRATGRAGGTRPTNSGSIRNFMCSANGHRRARPVEGHQSDPVFSHRAGGGPQRRQARPSQTHSHLPDIAERRLRTQRQRRRRRPAAGAAARRRNGHANHALSCAHDRWHTVGAQRR